MDVHGVYTEVLIRWMKALAAGQAPVIFGDGTQTMDFIDVRDIARANVLAAAAPVSDAVFNIASGVETSLLDLARALARAMEVDIAPTFTEARKVNPVARRLASTDAACRQLGFRAQIELDQGLRDLVAWWRQTNA
jgi:UDP-glucose 4-epimerase